MAYLSERPFLIHSEFLLYIHWTKIKLWKISLKWYIVIFYKIPRCAGLPPLSLRITPNLVCQDAAVSCLYKKERYLTFFFPSFAPGYSSQHTSFHPHWEVLILPSPHPKWLNFSTQIHIHTITDHLHPHSLSLCFQKFVFL